MFSQLVESNNHSKENKRRGGFLLSTFFVVCTVFASGILWSLFAKDLGMNAGNLEMSELIAPLPMVEDQPKPPEVQPKPSKQSAPPADVRTEIIQNITESPQVAPDKISSQKSNIPPRDPNKLTIVGDNNISRENSVSSDYKGEVNPNAKGLDFGDGTPNGEGKDNATATVPPPPPPVKKEDVKPKSDQRISLGVVNGKAINLVVPPYPAAAKAIRAFGEVNVQVAIDEKGNVTSANAVSGHPLLRQTAENAARASKFKPTLLSKEPVKVSGVIVYKFAAQ